MTILARLFFPQVRAQKLPVATIGACLCAFAVLGFLDGVDTLFRNGDSHSLYRILAAPALGGLGLAYLSRGIFGRDPGDGWPWALAVCSCLAAVYLWSEYANTNRWQFLAPGYVMLAMLAGVVAPIWDDDFWREAKMPPTWAVAIGGGLILFYLVDVPLILFVFALPLAFFLYSGNQRHG